MQPDETFGVLAGWSHRELNGRLDLRLQTVRSTRRSSPQDADLHHIIMTRNQAAVLANYLFQAAGQTPPKRRRKGLLGKFLNA